MITDKRFPLDDFPLFRGVIAFNTVYGPLMKDLKKEGVQELLYILQTIDELRHDMFTANKSVNPLEHLSTHITNGELQVLYVPPNSNNYGRELFLNPGGPALCNTFEEAKTWLHSTPAGPLTNLHKDDAVRLAYNNTLVSIAYRLTYLYDQVFRELARRPGYEMYLPNWWRCVLEAHKLVWDTYEEGDDLPDQYHCALEGCKMDHAFGGKEVVAALPYPHFILSRTFSHPMGSFLELVDEEGGGAG